MIRKFPILLVLTVLLAVPLFGCSNSTGNSTAPEGEGMKGMDNPSTFTDAAAIPEEKTAPTP